MGRADSVPVRGHPDIGGKQKDCGGVSVPPLHSQALQRSVLCAGHANQPGLGILRQCPPSLAGDHGRQPPIHQFLNHHPLRLLRRVSCDSSALRRPLQENPPFLADSGTEIDPRPLSAAGHVQRPLLPHHRAAPQ